MAEIVSGYVPTGVVLDALTVSVALPGTAIEDESKLAVAPLGRPLTLRLTCPLNPPVGVTVTV